MHMADALISPAVGGGLWAVAAVLMAGCCRRVRRTLSDRRIPLMGVLGAFVFAAQMINFSIPGTGSSGHLGGGLLLAILLGPAAAFLTIASVLTVQAFFFFDGGLLALGCNIVNLGVFPCFVAYPLLYCGLGGGRGSGARLWWVTVLAAVLGLELGALGVVVETRLSGLAELPLGKFLLLMLPIHLPIGVVEGAVTAGVVTYVRRVRPEALELSEAQRLPSVVAMRPLVVGLGVAALLTAGVLSWFASTHPDGLEWALARSSGHEEIASPETDLHRAMASVQRRTAVFPDYAAPSASTEVAPGSASAGGSPPAWPAVAGDTTRAGLLGGLLTIALVLLLAVVLRQRSACSRPPAA